MLLTLNVNSLRPMLRPASGEPTLTLAELPVFVRDMLNLHGLNLPTDLLAGATRDTLGALRERADKAGCACLLLYQPTALDFGSTDESVTRASIQRMTRVVEAASVLGCNSAAMRIADRPADPLATDRLARNVRKVVDFAERLEVNLLLTPHEGFTGDPDELTGLIKKIGGFRIGTYPDFEAASSSDDPEAYLRRLTPYASVVNAATLAFDAADMAADDHEPTPEPSRERSMVLGELDGEPDDEEGLDPDDEINLDEIDLDDEEPALPVPPRHEPYELEPLLRAIIAVGFDQTLAIDYRGSGDCERGIATSRRAIDATLQRLAMRG